MFIETKYKGYNRAGDQIAAGLFLILMQPKYDSLKYPAHSDRCECGKTRAQHFEPLPADVQAVSDTLHRTWKYLFEERTIADSETLKDAAEILLDAKHQVEGCRYFRPAANAYPLRAIVRYTSLKQLGHFMMGYARVHGTRITLSGAYGGDGLPCSVPDEVYQTGIELPRELYDAWNKGNGWNGAGSEEPAMRRWALEHLGELRK